MRTCAHDGTLRLLATCICAQLAIACTGDLGGSPTDRAGADGTAAAPGAATQSTGGAGGSALPGTGGDGMPAPGALDDCATADTGQSVLRRLTRDEYAHTLRALFELAEPPDVSQVPDDAEQAGFRTIAALQGVSDQHLRAYLEVAERLGGELLADGARATRVIGCQTSAPDCLRSFVERFGQRAFRRPLSADEVASLASAAEAGARDADDRYRFAIEALLTAPSFLFRVELGDGSPLSQLTPGELASRLSFTLTGRGPSAELLERAEAGELATAEGLSAAAEELLATPEARATFRTFFEQWLGFETLRVPNTPPPGFTPELLPQMIEETARLLDDYAWQPGLRFTDALTASYTYLTPELGEFYGIAVSGSGFSRVELPRDHARAGTGLLTHASVISSKTDADLISHRGAFLRDALLCQELRIPAELQEQIQGSVAGLSYLEVVALRNRDQPCAGCHAQIDPIGVAFSQYDAIGHHDASVDVAEFGLTPSFSGLQPPEFATLAELGERLAAEPKVVACLAEKLFIYTQGRAPESADACTLSLARQHFADSGGRFASMASAMVQAPGFRLRRAPMSEARP